MRLLVVSHLLPNPAEPDRGRFVWDQVVALRELCEVRAVGPVPWFPLKLGPLRWARWYYVPRYERKEGIALSHPRYVTFPRRWAFSLVWAFYLKSLSAEASSPFDLVHAHVLYPDGMAAVALGRLLGRPVVVTAHGSDVNLYPYQRRLWRTLTVWTAERADRVVAVSTALKENLHALGARRARVVVVPDGVDGRKFFPMDKSSCARSLGLEPGRRKVLYVGSIEEGKGVGVLLEAFERLEGVELFLIGRKVEGYPSRPGVHFVGPVPHARVPLWMGASDLVVQPSFSEGFGMTLVEALSCGRPVVATESGGPKDIVGEEVGALVPPGDPEALADAIDHVLGNLGRYRPEELHAYVQGRFGLERVAERLFELYREVLHGSGVKGGPEGQLG
ncbi:MAG TPA: glycosyltransferase family 4 protein [Candidatus Latescibacteria bacterium]|nr:glycosyltransferase family 4 protein [Candidatus Latescibacterota bacterium]